MKMYIDFQDKDLEISGFVRANYDHTSTHRGTKTEEWFAIDNFKIEQHRNDKWYEVTDELDKYDIDHYKEKLISLFIGRKMAGL